MAKSDKGSSSLKDLLKKRIDLPGASASTGDKKSAGKLQKDVKAPKPVKASGKYVKDSTNELSKVTWPTRKESIRLSIAVLIFSGFLTAFIAVLDYVFGEIVQRFIIGG